MRKMTITPRLCFAIAASVIGNSIPIGYNYGIVNSPEKVLKEFIRKCLHRRCECDPTETMVTSMYGLMVAAFSIGSIVGGPLAGHLTQRLGRKGTILLATPLSIVGSLLQFSSKYAMSLEMLLIGRALAGFKAGICMVAQPMYLSEIAPKEKRGLCGTSSQVCMALGVTLAQIFGMTSVLGTSDLWHYAFGFNLIPAVYQLLTLPFCPETPRYLLLTKHDEHKARDALKWLRGEHKVDEHLEEMLHERAALIFKQKFTVCRLIKNSSLRRRLLLCSTIRATQQFSGIYAVVYFSTGVFEIASFSTEQSQWATIGTSAVYTVVVMFCGCIVDKAGRRTLLLLGFGGMFVFNVILTEGLLFQKSSSFVPYVCVVAVMFVRLFFAIGPASIPSFLAAEMFTQEARSTAITIVVFTTRLSNVLVAFLFPIVKAKIGPYSFIPFVICLACLIPYLQHCLPETKGKTYKEIEELFTDEEEKALLDDDLYN